MLTKIQITKFQEIYKKHYGNDINPDEALEYGSKLIRLIELVYKPISRHK